MAGACGAAVAVLLNDAFLVISAGLVVINKFTMPELWVRAGNGKGAGGAIFSVSGAGDGSAICWGWLVDRSGGTATLFAMGIDAGVDGLVDTMSWLGSGAGGGTTGSERIFAPGG